MEILGTLFFSLAILHTFLAGRFREKAHHYPEQSVASALFHFLGEIEVVFGLWAAVLMTFLYFHSGSTHVVSYLESLHFAEPMFVFVIMAVCSTRPITEIARQGIVRLSGLLRGLLRTPEVDTELFVILTVGPLAGSFITEPAAMTVTALLLNSMLHTKRKTLIYALIAVLFVNISVGGAMTPYAAPPILMVAKAWGWDFSFVFSHLGWRALVAVFVNAILYVLIFHRQLRESFYTLKHLETRHAEGDLAAPLMLSLLHLVFLVGVILNAHHPVMFISLFLFFLGLVTITKKYQSTVRFKESLLVASFLAGIVVFGPFQTWWLQPLLAKMTDTALFFGATGLTAITDNAALTYLGSQVPELSESARYALVAGALAGGGLTVIANAPNPAGYSILSHKFPDGQIKPLPLFLSAVPPTCVAIFCFWFL